MPSYFRAFGFLPTEALLLLAGAVVAVSALGALSQHLGWSRSGPTLVLVGVAASVVTAGALRWRPGWAVGGALPLLVFLVVPCLGAYLPLVALRRRPLAARMLGAVSAGLVLALIAPLAALWLSCVLTGDCL